MSKEEKYTVAEPGKLKSWEPVAKKEIMRWLYDQDYQNFVTKTTMIYESMGPFTKFLYHFASKCNAGWGVMVDFNEKTQKIFLTDHFYKWIHKLRDSIYDQMQSIGDDNEFNPCDGCKNIDSCSDFGCYNKLTNEKA